MKKIEIPDVELLKKELDRVNYKTKYRSVLKNDFYAGCCSSNCGTGGNNLVTGITDLWRFYDSDIGRE